MARDQLPSAKERRRLLQQKDGGLAQAGGKFLQEGRWGEALECLAAAGHQAGLAELAEQALAAGDLFTWRLALQALGQAPTAQGLDQLRQKASALGKQRFAQAALALLEPADTEKP